MPDHSLHGQFHFGRDFGSMFEVQQLGLGLGQHDVAGDSPRLALEALAEVRIPLMSHRPVILVSFSTGFSASGLACPVRIRHLFRWFSRATLGAMPLWLLTYKFTCSQAECGYHNALDAVAQADTPKTAASQVGKSQHLCGRCGRPLTDSSSLKMAVPVPISSVEKKRSVSESGKQRQGSCRTASNLVECLLFFRLCAFTADSD